MPLQIAFNPRRSLRARFALVMGGSGLAFALLSALVVDGYERAQLVDSLGQAMRREAVLLSRSLNLALRERLQPLRDAASTPILASGLMEPGDTRMLLEAMRTQHPSLAWAAVTDAAGRVRVATSALLEGESLAGQPLFEQALKGPWIGARRPAGPLAGHLGLSGSDAPSLIDLGAPLIDLQGRTVGAVVARLRWDWLDTLHAQMEAGGRRQAGSSTVVLDRGGQVLLGPAEWLDKPLPLPGLPQLAAGTEARVMAWPAEGEFLSAYGRDEDTPDSAGLAVLVRQPVALAFQAADGLRSRLLGLGLAATLAFIALSLWMGGRIARPVQALSAAARRVETGEPPEFSAITPQRRDEVAELALVLQNLHLQLAQRLDELRRASERYEALFRDAPVAIYVTQDSRLRLANRACLELFGAAEPAPLLGKTSFDLVHPDDHAALKRQMARRDEQRAGDPALPALAHRIVRLDGSVAQVESTAMSVTLGDRPAVQVVLVDRTEQRRAQELLHRREAQLVRTSGIAHVGGWSIDVDGGSGSWTDEMARIYELPPGTVPNAKLALSYFHGEHRERLKAAIAQLMADGQPYDLELPLRTPAGNEKWVRTQGHPVRDGSGRIVALEGITQDVTDRRAAQDALRELNTQLEQRVAERTAELQAANDELDSFAYAVSHDLRAPLRAMSGFSEALREDYGEQLDAHARGYLDQITEASRRMGELIEGLLVLSRMLRGLVRSDDVDLSALATHAVEQLRRAEPGREVDVEIEPGLRACGDRRMLDAVFTNLIGNAWKYTAKTAAPRIRVGRIDLDGRSGFHVSDNGAGFDMAHAGRLFKAFARLHRQDEFPGIGIGLATVQRIVHRHGGQVVAQAAPGQGASFRFTLPGVRATEPATQEH